MSDTASIASNAGTCIGDDDDVNRGLQHWWVQDEWNRWTCYYCTLMGPGDYDDDSDDEIYDDDDDEEEEEEMDDGEYGEEDDDVPEWHLHY